MIPKFVPVDFDSECSYLNVDFKMHTYPTQILPNSKKFCMKIEPFGINKEKPDSSISRFHTAIHTAADDIGLN